jgi:hypothetical protein
VSQVSIVMHLDHFVRLEVTVRSEIVLLGVETPFLDCMSDSLHGIVNSVRT